MTSKKHKMRTFFEARDQLYKETPVILAMEKLFQKLDDVLFCFKDRDGRYLWANDAFLRRVPIASGADLIGRTASEVFPELLAAAYEQQDARLIAEGRETHDRLEMITNPDGSLGWFLSEKILIRGRDSDILAIACMSRDLHASASGDPRLKSLAVALDRMRRDYAEPLRITQLAVEAELSLSRFERLMRSVMHISPRQFLTRQRVEAAAGLLRHTDKSIAAIALDCGFCDQPTFCRQFKAVTGTTAFRYRKLVRFGESN